MADEKIEGKQGEQNEQVTTAQFNELLTLVKGLQEENKVLKAHADETIQEKRAMKARLDEDQATRDKELEAKVNRTKEENEQLLKQYQDKIANLENEKKTYQERDYNNRVQAKAKELANGLAKTDQYKAEDLAEKFAKRIRLEEDGSIKVLDANGNVTISPVDALVNEISTRYAYLCDGVQSTGGGSHSSGAGAQSKKLSEMSEAEQVELYKTDIAKYRELEKG